jgi:hypothetical protein
MMAISVEQLQSVSEAILLKADRAAGIRAPMRAKPSGTNTFKNSLKPPAAGIPLN